MMSSGYLLLIIGVCLAFLIAMNIFFIAKMRNSEIYALDPSFVKIHFGTIFTLLFGVFVGLFGLKEILEFDFYSKEGFVLYASFLLIWTGLGMVGNLVKSTHVETLKLKQQINGETLDE